MLRRMNFHCSKHSFSKLLSNYFSRCKHELEDHWEYPILVVFKRRLYYTQLTSIVRTNLFSDGDVEEEGTTACLHNCQCFGDGL